MWVTNVNKSGTIYCYTVYKSKWKTIDSNFFSNISYDWCHVIILITSISITLLNQTSVVRFGFCSKNFMMVAVGRFVESVVGFQYGDVWVENLMVNILLVKNVV